MASHHKKPVATPPDIIAPEPQRPKVAVFTVAISTDRGVRAAGSVATADLFRGGVATLEALVKKGFVKEVPNG
jgi:hypothetical protein